jgi:hypothetical protein
MVGKIYIASMNMRGKWAEPFQTLSEKLPQKTKSFDDPIVLSKDGTQTTLLKNYIKINVTSAQAKANKNRLNFSPMTEIVNGYKGYWNFESYWQSGKVYEDIPIEKTKKWWRGLKELLGKQSFSKTTLSEKMHSIFF